MSCVVENLCKTFDCAEREAETPPVAKVEEVSSSPAASDTNAEEKPSIPEPESAKDKPVVSQTDAEPANTAALAESKDMAKSEEEAAPAAMDTDTEQTGAEQPASQPTPNKQNDDGTGKEDDKDAKLTRCVEPK